MTPEQKIERIEKALARGGTHTWEDVRDGLRAGRCQIFDSESGVWITEVMDTPLKRILHCWVVAGELPGVMALQKNVEDFARAHDCQTITAEARTGWKHVAKAYGWKQTSIMIAKDLYDA